MGYINKTVIVTFVFLGDVYDEFDQKVEITEVSRLKKAEILSLSSETDVTQSLRWCFNVSENSLRGFFLQPSLRQKVQVLRQQLG